jgi:hypothetical protein
VHGAQAAALRCVVWRVWERTSGRVDCVGLVQVDSPRVSVLVVGINRGVLKV